MDPEGLSRPRFVGEPVLATLTFGKHVHHTPRASGTTRRPAITVTHAPTAYVISRHEAHQRLGTH